jgi:hypothetical protein
MTIDEMAKYLEETVQPHGKEAWKIATEWAKNGRLKKLSLHDLHELSKMISDALDDAHQPAPKPERMKDLDSTQLAVIGEMFREQFAPKPEGSCEMCGGLALRGHPHCVNCSHQAADNWTPTASDGEGV